MSGKERHPDDETIIKAVVDESDLSHEILLHLRHCEICKRRRTALEEDLKRFSSFVDELIPDPERRVIIEERDKGESLVYRRFSAFATVIILMITVAGLFSFMPASGPQNAKEAFTVAELIREMEKHKRLADKVSALEENIMPQFYVELSGDADVDQFDEFMDFIFPMEEETNGV